MTQGQARQKLPPEVQENVVEVELRHVFFAFGTVVTTILVTGTALVMLRDYARYRRQKAIIDAAGNFINTLLKGDHPWKKETKDSSFQTKRLDTQE